MTARSVTVTASPPVSQAAGTVVAISPDLSSFTLQTPSGQTITFSTGGVTSIVAGFRTGDAVQVSYVQAADGTLTARQVVSAATGTAVTGQSVTDRPVGADRPLGHRPVGLTRAPAHQR
jgi:hypothetical protein